MPSIKIASVDRSRCASCGACRKVCPREAIEIYRGCYARVDASRCVGCGKCRGICPAGCLALKERDEA